jgi:SAM-dependent methyltransferase
VAEGYVLQAFEDTEVDRLREQHAVWKDVTDDVLARAGFGRGQSLADLGCGPGFLSLELADLVGPDGTVDAVDTSERFVAYLRDDARARGLARLRPRVADARDLDAPDGSLDGAVCRWVLMFLPDPGRVVENVARMLRPSGTFAALEYTSFRSMSLRPDGRAFRLVYDAVHELIARNGGDADVGGRVPALAAEAGLEVVETVPFRRTGRPGSALWRWLSSVHPNHSNLVEAGLITPRELRAFHAEWDRHAADPSSSFTAPPLLATIARKP